MVDKKENKTLPYVWVVVHYGLNYLKSDQVFKRLIGYWFWLHWKLRWFDAPGVKWAMFFRKKFLELICKNNNKYHEKYILGINLPIKARCHESGVALIDKRRQCYFCRQRGKVFPKKTGWRFPCAVN